jgi:hypothetical protein
VVGKIDVCAVVLHVLHKSHAIIAGLLGCAVWVTNAVADDVGEPSAYNGIHPELNHRSDIVVEVNFVDKIDKALCPHARQRQQ